MCSRDDALYELPVTDISAKLRFAKVTLLSTSGECSQDDAPDAPDELLSSVTRVTLCFRASQPAVVLETIRCTHVWSAVSIDPHLD